MELFQLRTLVHVAELGSLSKAADRLRLTQPALSRHIRLLEAEFGARLFERHGRGMILTVTGRECLDHALRVFTELDELRSWIMERGSVLTGKVNIGLPPAVAEVLALPLVQVLRDKHPKIVLRFVTVFSGYLQDWLQRGEIDVAVLSDPQPARSIRSRELLTEGLFLVGPADAGFRLDDPFEFSNLSREALLLPSTRQGLRMTVDRLAAQLGIEINVIIETDSFQILKALAQAGNGRTILPYAAIRNAVEKGELSARPIVNPIPIRKLVLALSRDRPANRLVRAVSEIIETVLLKIMGDHGFAKEAQHAANERRRRAF